MRDRPPEPRLTKCRACVGRHVEMASARHPLRDRSPSCGTRGTSRVPRRAGWWLDMHMELVALLSRCLRTSSLTRKVLAWLSAITSHSSTFLQL